MIRARPVVTLVAAICVTACLGAEAARADAWGASWGRANAHVTPLDISNNSQLAWNTSPSAWLVHAEADVQHYHPAYSRAHQFDTEPGNLPPDGLAMVGPVVTADVASVSSVRAAVASAGGPYVDISTFRDVYSSAHDLPNSQSFASGLGQHDNLFSIQYTGVGEPVGTTPVLISLIGPWNLAGYSDPDDNWFADTFAYVEVYQQNDITNQTEVLAHSYEYHSLSGPGGGSASGQFNLHFTIDAAYGRSYALRFYLDDESSAIAVPAPGTLVLLGLGAASLLRRRRNQA